MLRICTYKFKQFEQIRLKNGVTDGARTHDSRNHNPGLYQLSYGHHRNYSPSGRKSRLGRGRIMGDGRKRIKQSANLGLLSVSNSRNIFAEHCSAVQFYSGNSDPNRGTKQWT